MMPWDVMENKNSYFVNWDKKKYLKLHRGNNMKLHVTWFITNLNVFTRHIFHHSWEEIWCIFATCNHLQRKHPKIVKSFLWFFSTFIFWFISDDERKKFGIEFQSRKYDTGYEYLTPDSTFWFSQHCSFKHMSLCPKI